MSHCLGNWLEVGPIYTIVCGLIGERDLASGSNHRDTGSGCQKGLIQLIHDFPSIHVSKRFCLKSVCFGSASTYVALIPGK